MEKRSSNLWMVGFLTIAVINCTVILTKGIRRDLFPPEVEEVYLEDDIYYFDRDNLEITFEGKHFKVVFYDKETFDKYLNKIRKESILEQKEK